MADLAQDGAVVAVRVTPRARGNGIERDGDTLRIRVTAPAEDGRANEAARRILAGALGVAPSRLVLVRGASARDKLFRLEPGGAAVQPGVRPGPRR
jgi:uncharacterized protein YggU (UPF0235/DUF167 family)